MIPMQFKKYVPQAGKLSKDNPAEGKKRKIAIVAPVSAGKSTLLNALCEYPILPVASGVATSKVTYISRVNSHKEECVRVLPLVRETVDYGGVSVLHCKPAATGKTFYADDINEEMFDKLLQYARFVMKGDEKEHLTTIENLVYFMRSTQAVDIGFGGSDSEKRNIPDSEFALDYEIERHRFVLLLVLLCLYVKQNEDNAALSPYKKEVLSRRMALMGELGLPPEEDFYIELNWCSNSIPAGATLIDFPVIVFDDRKDDGKCSNNALLRDVLEDADAFWVLCSDNGTTDRDLMDALKDDIQLHPEKSKVCIYNCKNKNYNDSTPVKEFIEKIRWLAGERCYVVNALAGEYMFTQNGIPIENTCFAYDLRKTMKDLLGKPVNDYTQAEADLKEEYDGVRYPVFETIDRGPYVDAVKNPDITYSLEQLFHVVLARESAPKTV